VQTEKYLPIDSMQLTEMNLELLVNEPALLLTEGTRRVLVVADLHLGYEQVLLKKETHSPRLSQVLIDHLHSLVREVQPTEIVILGDLKHSVRGLSRSELRQVSLLLQSLQQEATVTVVRGNHDADIEMLLPDGVVLAPSSGMQLKFESQQMYLLHGHALPGVEILQADALLMAHIHPTIAIPSLKEHHLMYQVWVRARWNPTIAEAMTSWFGKRQPPKQAASFQHLLKTEVLIMPAFLDLLPGLILNRGRPEDRAGDPLWPRLAIEEAEIIMLDHTPLGTLDQLTVDLAQRTRKSLRFKER
jgi:putative SbcD/Mre11-related phosphoesterase